MNNNDMLTVQEVAEALGVTTRTIRNYIADGKLKGSKIGGQWKFLRSDLYKQIGIPVENPIFKFLEDENVSQIDAIFSVNVPITSPDKIEKLKNELIDQYNKVYDGGENRKFYYQVISPKRTIITLQGPPEYVTNFGSWITDSLRYYWYVSS